MKTRDFLFQRGAWHSVAGMALLTLLTGCVGYVEGPRAIVVVDQPVAGVTVILELTVNGIGPAVWLPLSVAVR